MSLMLAMALANMLAVAECLSAEHEVEATARAAVPVSMTH